MNSSGPEATIKLPMWKKGPKKNNLDSGRLALALNLKLFGHLLIQAVPPIYNSVLNPGVPHKFCVSHTQIKSHCGSRCCLSVILKGPRCPCMVLETQ